MRQLVKEKENSDFKPVKLRLKIDLVSYPARAEGLVNMISTALENYMYHAKNGWKALMTSNGELMLQLTCFKRNIYLIKVLIRAMQKKKTPVSTPHRANICIHGMRIQ